ncbi:hypothetical protein HKX48_004636 [Thoreauomyces humboldtii]|nr:hypothetical protein HKX48_004636 [Thoreauomyces humboldtii]
MTLLDHFKNLTVKAPESAGKRKLYQTKNVIGEGTFGVVREAIYTPTGRSVALKSIKKRGHDTPEEVELAVRREMAVLEKIRHPNIISLLDWFETKDKYYMVFDLATGGELYERIAKRGKFTERDAVRLVYTILNAIAFLHARNIVHRDLKPENLLLRTLEADADLMIADFGVANFVEEDQLLSTLCGSPMYASPEVIKRSGHGKPADLWSIGVITYCLLAGYPPFDYAEDMADLMDAITRAKYRFDSPYWDAISPEGAKDFVKSLLQLKPAERPTARQAMLHPWLLKWSQRARDAAVEIEKEDEKAAGATADAPARDDSTIVEGDHLDPDEDANAHVAPPATVSPAPGEEDDLPNLVERVWSAHPDSLFNARGKLLTAIRTVQAMRRLSVKKSSESAATSSDSLPAVPEQDTKPKGPA